MDIPRNEKGQFIKGFIYTPQNLWSKDNPGFKGFKHTLEAKNKISLAKLGKYNQENNPNWKGGKPHCKDCGKIVSTYTSLRCIKCNSTRPKTKIQIKNSLKHRGMSGLEKHVLQIIDKYELPYKFVGDGKFFIEKKNPDFININGEKKAIEVYYKRHKDQFRKGGFEGWKKEREEIFSKYGWEIIFIEGYNITEKIILQALKGGY